MCPLNPHLCLSICPSRPANCSPGGAQFRRSIHDIMPYVYTYIYIHTYMHACIHAYIHTYRYTYTHVHIYTYTYIYTCIYIHVYIYIFTSSMHVNVHVYLVCIYIYCISMILGVEQACCFYLTTEEFVTSAINDQSTGG